MSWEFRTFVDVLGGGKWGPLDVCRPRTIYRPPHGLAASVGSDVMLLTWDLDVAVYSSNWGLARRSLPSRTCAHCFWRFELSGVEDESHILFVCRLYSALCGDLPFTGTQVRVEGDAMQGDGCTLCRGVVYDYFLDAIFFVWGCDYLPFLYTF